MDGCKIGSAHVQINSAGTKFSDEAATEAAYLRAIGRRLDTGELWQMFFAVPPMAWHTTSPYVAFVPIGDIPTITRSTYSRASDNCRRHSDAELLGALDVDGQFECSRLLHR